MTLRTAYPTFFRLARLFAYLASFRWWTWRLTRRLLLAAVLLLTFVSLVYTVENWRGRRAFAAVAREAAAAGLSFTLRDLAAPPIPDSLNLAKIPLLDHPPVEDPNDPFWPDLANRFRFQTGHTALSNHFPDWSPIPAENRPIDLATIRAELKSYNDSVPIEDLETYLARISPALDELSAASAARPGLRLEYAWEQPESIIIMMPHLVSLRALSQSATLQALVYLEQDRPADAARAMRIPLRLRSALQSELGLWSQSTANDLGGLATGTIWQGQQTHQWTPAELDLFAEMLADDRILAGFRRSLAAQAALNVSWSLRLADKTSELANYWAERRAAGDKTMSPLTRILPWAPSGWASQNAAIFGHIALEEWLPSIDLDQARIYPERLVTRSESLAGFAGYSLIARMILPNFRYRIKAAGQAKTTHDLARLAVALEQHLLARDTYPESLAPVLAASPVLATLHDPFTGEPYRYRRDIDGGFTLWGSGRNARDENATYPSEKDNPYEKNAKIPDYDTGDLVWHVPGRPVVSPAP